MDKAHLTEKIAEYARLIVKLGLNPDPGQEVFITAALDQPEFVRLVVEECYRAGTGAVNISWMDQKCDKLHANYQSEQDLSRLRPWEEARWKFLSESCSCRLWLDSDDPDAMNGIEVGKYSRALQSRMKQIKPYREAMENRHQWCIAAVPGLKWARKVFGEAGSDGEVIDRLWEAVLRSSRVLDGDAVDNWQKHNASLQEKCRYLNGLDLRELHYTSCEGTDLTVGLMPEGVFAGGCEEDLSHRVFNPNIPSEEIFTTPQAGAADGWVVATKPLSYQGQLIDKFAIRFENGRAVEVKAETGQSVLEELIKMDENAGKLGECALIPEESPINRQNLLFYNTLFDENACCHLALGRGFDVCVRDFGSRTPEELKALGVNDSIIHVDFMIGSRSLNIDAVDASGRVIPLFRNGNWC